MLLKRKHYSHIQVKIGDQGLACTSHRAKPLVCLSGSAQVALMSAELSCRSFHAEDEATAGGKAFNIIIACIAHRF